jgi:outer membrane lipoprotein SlyB
MHHRIIALLAAAAMLTGCARDMASDTYSQSAVAGKVVQGVIISARPVKIKAHDKLQDNTAGGLVGGAGGAVAGASVGSGTGSIVSGIGGALVGAAAGAYIEDALGTTEGMEYLVQLDEKHARRENKNKKVVKEHAGSAINDDINMSIDTDLQTSIISVVQKPDPALSEGSPVYVVYNDERPRLVPVHKPAKNPS